MCGPLDQVTATDRLGLSYTVGFTIVIVYTPLPPGVSSKFMAIAENSVAGSLVREMRGRYRVFHACRAPALWSLPLH